MADIHIQRQHGMSFAQARKAATQWASQAEEKFDMTCSYQPGQDMDQLSFTRSGVSGTLSVNAEVFELKAKLGFLLGAFKEKIEGEIVKTLDQLIASNAVGAPKTVAKKTPDSQA
jgi:putative polyhydroxyalkanoate system protein